LFKLTHASLALLLTFATTGAVAETASAPAYAIDGGEWLSEHEGIDDCTLPSTTVMDAWDNTDYYNFYAYLGGSNACSASLTSSWIEHVITSPGYYDVVFTWVGPQMSPTSCGGQGGNHTFISLDTSTAYTQGENEASAAYGALINLGVNTDGAPLAYDLEGYGGQSSCRAAAKSFMKGWADYLGSPPAQESGVYGSSCGSYLDDFASDGNPPDFIWGANTGTTKSTSSIQCVASNHWTLHQRHKQWVGQHNETHGGYTLTIDTDCANGPVYGTGGNADGQCL
jgi:hypothetical protein